MKWGITRDAFFIEKLVEYKRADKKCGVSWRLEVWKELSQDFAAKFGVNASIMQLKARLQVIKLKYSQLEGCINQPGFTWDNECKMVEASDKDWDNYLKVQALIYYFFKPFIDLLLNHALKTIVYNPKIYGRKN